MPATWSAAYVGYIVGTPKISCRSVHLCTYSFQAEMIEVHTINTSVVLMQYLQEDLQSLIIKYIWSSCIINHLMTAFSQTCVCVCVVKGPPWQRVLCCSREGKTAQHHSL